MTEFKVGDRVKVEFEATIDSVTAKSVLMTSTDNHTQAWMLRENLTKLAPALPTKIGSVIDSHGYRFMLSAYGWRSDADKTWIWSDAEFRGSMYAKEFTVVLEGK